MYIILQKRVSVPVSEKTDLHPYGLGTIIVVIFTERISRTVRYISLDIVAAPTAGEDLKRAVEHLFEV